MPLFTAMKKHLCSDKIHHFWFSVIQGEIDTEKMTDAQGNFDKLNQNMRRELEHFDTVMREEFGETFDKYHKQYRTALSMSNNTWTLSEI